MSILALGRKEKKRKFPIKRAREKKKRKFPIKRAEEKQKEKIPNQRLRESKKRKRRCGDTQTCLQEEKKL